MNLSTDDLNITGNFLEEKFRTKFGNQLNELTIYSNKNFNELLNNKIESGILLIDKPQNWTSFDIVAKVRNLLKLKKIGHTGTLDPLASGLLILCLGKATKLVELLQSQEKEYTGTITLGASTRTDDLEAIPENLMPTEHITHDLIVENVQGFIGETQQVPPIYSALKVGGKKMYQLARKGLDFSPAPRKIFISAFEITRITNSEINVMDSLTDKQLNVVEQLRIDKNFENISTHKTIDIEFRIVCSKGTYIRSIARDFGHNLGNAAYLSQLRRTRSGNFSLEHAVVINDLISHFKIPVKTL